MAGGYDWADEFDAYIKASVLEGQHEAAVSFERAGASAGQAFTYRDHYDPLLYVLGAADQGDPARIFNEERVMDALSMTSILSAENVQDELFRTYRGDET